MNTILLHGISSLTNRESFDSALQLFLQSLPERDIQYSAQDTGGVTIIQVNTKPDASSIPAEVTVPEVPDDEQLICAVRIPILSNIIIQGIMSEKTKVNELLLPSQVTRIGSFCSFNYGDLCHTVDLADTPIDGVPYVGINLTCDITCDAEHTNQTTNRLVKITYDPTVKQPLILLSKDE